MKSVGLNPNSLEFDTRNRILDVLNPVRTSPGVSVGALVEFGKLFAGVPVKVFVNAAVRLEPNPELDESEYGAPNEDGK